LNSGTTVGDSPGALVFLGVGGAPVDVGTAVAGAKAPVTVWQARVAAKSAKMKKMPPILLAPDFL
jgi:hypothetical protein